MIEQIEHFLETWMRPRRFMVAIFAAIFLIIKIPRSIDLFSVKTLIIHDAHGNILVSASF